MDLLHSLTVPAIHIGALLSEGWGAFRGASQWNEVPLVEPSLGIALGAMLDRTFTVATNVLTGVPSPDEVRRFNTEAVAMRDFLEENGWLEDPAGYHMAPPPVSDWATAEGATWLGPRRQHYQHLSWPSGYELLPGEPGRDHWLSREDNRTMHAYVM